MEVIVLDGMMPHYKTTPNKKGEKIHHVERCDKRGNRRERVLVPGASPQLAALDALRERMGISTHTGHKEADETKLVTYSFDAGFPWGHPKAVPLGGFKSLEFLHLTDLQIGSKGFQRKRFVEYRDWILSRPNRFVFLGGDIIDAATVISIASPYENDAEPIDQVDDAVKLLRPLADAGRLLGYVGGNHERRTIKTFGDCGRLIARSLNVPYSRGVQLIDINYGAHKSFRISLWHGSGSARTKGAKAQMLHRFMHQADSQVYLVGHLHDVVLLFDWRQRRIGKRIKLEKIAGIMSSSFQAYWNSYAEVYAMSPSDTMMARIILEPNGKWEVTLR